MSCVFRDPLDGLLEELVGVVRERVPVRLLLPWWFIINNNTDGSGDPCVSHGTARLSLYMD